MKKNPRFDDIRPLFISKIIETFSDLFKILRKTEVARFLGKEKSRFTYLINSPGGFKMIDMIRLSDRCKLTLPEIGELIETEHPTNGKLDGMKKIDEYKFIKPLFDAQKINLLEDIFSRVPKSTVANDIGRNRGRFNELMNHVENFRVKDILAIGELCELTLPEMFKLVRAQYDKQINKNPE